MKVTKTLKLEMTEKEKEAIKLVYGMLYDLDYDEDKELAYELGYGDLTPMKTDLTILYRLGGGNEEDLE